MAFTFDRDDVKMGAGTGLMFGGEYNTEIVSVEHKGKTKGKNSNDYWVVKFQVVDTDQAGAQVTHVFIDDSDNENAFNYRAINALLVAVNYQATGVLDLLQVMPQLLNQKLAIQVKKFEESTYKDSNGVDRTAYNPKVNDLSPWMPKGSVVDQSIAKPEVAKPNAQQGGFGGQGGFGSPAPQSQGGFGGAPLPPEPQQDPFAANNGFN